MAFLSFDAGTVILGAATDWLRLCQPALLGAMAALFLLFVRDKRQMLRTSFWAIGLSILVTILSAYGAFSFITTTLSSAFANILVGIVLFTVGIIEMYRHDILKAEPLRHPLVAAAMKWLRRSTLPLLAMLSSIIQPPCTSGPYTLLTEALTTRPGPIIEAYLLSYTLLLFLPYIALLSIWYGILSIPGIEHIKSTHRFLIRITVGSLTTLIGILLLWNAHSILLLPGLSRSLLP